MSDNPGQDLDGVGTAEVSLGNLVGRGLIAEPEKLVTEDWIPEPFLLAEDGSNFLNWRRKREMIRLAAGCPVSLTIFLSLTVELPLAKLHNSLPPVAQHLLDYLSLNKPRFLGDHVHLGQEPALHLHVNCWGPKILVVCKESSRTEDLHHKWDNLSPHLMKGWMLLVHGLWFAGIKFVALSVRFLHHCVSILKSAGCQATAKTRPHGIGMPPRL